jgi:hypothetical protein
MRHDVSASFPLHKTMLDIIYRLLAVSSVSALSWMLYQLALICHRGAVLARQFRNPPVRNKLMGTAVGFAPPPCRSRVLRTKACHCSAPKVLTQALHTSPCDNAGGELVSTTADETLVLGYCCAGHVAEVSTPDIHRLMLQYVKDYGPIFRLRLIWRHTVVVTEVGRQHEHHGMMVLLAASADASSLCSLRKSASTGIVCRTVCMSLAS